jgi:hypothetical protein
LCSLQDQSPWATFKDLWPESEEAFTIENFACEEFTQLVSHNTSPQLFHLQMKTLFSLLDSSWDQEYSRYAVTQLKSSAGVVLKETIPSSFAIALQSLAWVAGVKVTVERSGDTAVVEEMEALFQPSSLYMPGQWLRFLFFYFVLLISPQFFYAHNANPVLFHWKSYSLKSKRQVLF